MDVSDLLDWSGHMTGVQRVMYEIMTCLIEDSAYEARFFKLSFNGKALVECDVTDMLARMSAQANEASTAPDDATEGRKKQIKAMVRKAYFALPTGVRQRITTEHKQKAKHVAHTALHQAKQLKHQFAQMAAKPGEQEYAKPADFRQDDTVLVVGKAWDDIRLVDLLAEGKRAVGYRYVTLVHDLIPVFQPHLFGPGLFNPYAQYLFEALTNCDRILCVSKNTEKDVQQLAAILNVPHVETAVVVLGDTPLTEIAAVRPNEVAADEPFILAVGTVEARKNHELLYQAYKLAKEQGKQLPRLIIVGSPGWLTNDFVYIAAHDPDTKDMITILRHIPDAQIRWLYEHCLLTVYPSIYEGWGLPVRESLAYGKHCITTTVASLPEAAGGHASLVSPYDSGAFLAQLLTDIPKAPQLNKAIACTYVPNEWRSTYAMVKKAL